jgi:hypothetical protein
MNQLRSEFEAGSTALEAPVADGRVPLLSGTRVDRLLAERPIELPVASPNPPPMHGIWLGVTAGILIWSLLAVAFVWLS